MAPTFDLIAFDGDDTLWDNERSYREGRRRFQRLLVDAGVGLDDRQIDEAVGRTEIANLSLFGYGVSSFVLSLIETAVDLTGGRVAGADLKRVIEIARDMLNEQIEVFADARDSLVALCRTYPLMLVTKGDLLHQTSKLDRSGLREYFNHVEVVSHKTSDVYAAILRRHGIDPARFLMVGNSVRSDVLPVVEVGGWAVHVPAALSWAHEDGEAPAGAEGRFFAIPALSALPPLVARIEQQVLQPGP